MTPAIDKAKAHAAIAGLMGAWLRRQPRCCDWCAQAFETVDDLDEWIAWCLQLGQLLDPRRKGLPAPKVFCRDCAMGAREELLTGRKYVSEVVPF